MRKLVLSFLAICLLISIETKAQSNGIDTTYANKGLATITPSYLLETGMSTPTSAFVDSLNRTIIIGKKVGTPTNIFATRILPNGNLDSSYGTNGTVLIPMITWEPNSYNIIRAQEDGKIITAGYYANSTYFKYDFVVRRFLANGNRDSSFGTNGYRSYPVSLNDDIPSDLVIAPGGKIIIAGTTQPTAGNEKAVLVRLLPDGTPDTTFNHTGLIVDGVFNKGQKVLVQTNGRIVLAGSVFIVGQGWDFNIYAARYFDNGEVDATFNNGTGYIVVPVLPQDDYVNDMHVLPDGRLNILADDSAIVQLNANGTKNLSFGTNGVQLVPRCKQIVPTSSNGFYTQYNSKVRKYFANGQLDTSFATNGVYNYVLSSGGDSSVFLVRQSNQNLLCIGKKTSLNISYTLVAGLNSSGQVWQGFGQDGNVLVKHTNFISTALTYYVHEQKALENGTIIVSFICNFEASKRYGLLKILPSGLHDLSFAGIGYYLHPFKMNNLLNDYKVAFNVSPSGSILAAISTQISPTKTNISLFKLTQNGYIDSSFGINGFVSDSTSDSLSNSKIGLQTNGSIILAAGKRIYRYSSSGLRDTTFSASPIALNDLYVTYTNQLLISSDTMLQRLTSSGKLDTLFAGKGRYVKPFIYSPFWQMPDTTEYSRFYTLSVEPNTRNIMVATALNYFQNSTNWHNSNWIRLSEDGYEVPGPNPFYSVVGSYEQITLGQIPFEDGSYLINTTVRSYITPTYIFAKFLKNGQLDLSFGKAGKLDSEISKLSSSIPFQTCPINSYQSYALVQSGSTIKVLRINSKVDYPLQFTASKTNIGFIDTVVFSPSFAGTATSYKWTFTPNTLTYLNGTNENSQNPILKFNSIASYQVSLEVGYNNTSKTVVKPNYINLLNKLDFTASKTTVLLSDSVLFTPIFLDPVKQYQWIISTPNKVYLAGTDSSSKEPLLKFTKPGIYDITLKLFYADTFQVLTKTAYIKLFPEVDFVANKTSAWVYDTLTLSPVSSETFSYYRWTITPNNVFYLSGTNANSRNPIFELQQEYFYDVQLVLGYLGETFSISKPAYFTINNKTGLQEQATAGIKVYPNPSQSQVTVQLGSNQTHATAYLYNTQGLLQAEYTLEESNTTLTLPEATGIYFLRIKTDSDKIYSLKLVKE